MELDDLRRQWQQTPPPSSAVSEAELRQLLAQPHRGPVAYMRRQVLIEAVAMVLSVVGCTGAVLYFRFPPFGVLLGTLLLLSMVTGYYYVSKWRVLRRLGERTGELRPHVERQVRSLRQLIRLSYWSSMAFAAVSVGLLAYWMHLLRLQAPLWLALTGVATLLITHFSVRYHLRTTYEPPLAQLSGYVRELAEAPHGE